jgi:inner membrane protein
MLQNIRNSVLAKIFGLFILSVFLLIPLNAIDRLSYERGASQREAADELAATYVGAQTVIGPVLVIPYVERWTETYTRGGKVIDTEERREESSLLMFPDKLHVEGGLAPQERYRGIFKILFYTFGATFEGTFPALDPAAVTSQKKGATIEFKTPYVVFSMSDLRGLDGSPTLQISDEALHFQPRAEKSDSIKLTDKDIQAPLSGAALAAWQARKPMPFTMRFSLTGHERLSIAPIADETTAHLTSPWAHPRFGGHFLATERTVNAQGFDARWRVSSLITSAREEIQSLAKNSARPVQSFDVSLAQPLNVYALSTRAGKYGFLFIGLVLAAVFMSDVFRKLRLHPVQYGLVGLSIALFFLLLLALSEKFAFWVAYASAAGASVLLLAVYFSAVLGGWKRGLGLGAYVAILYGALYGLLVSENNALLLGSLLIFGMLAALMLATRKVDWYALSAAPEHQTLNQTDLSQT